MSHVVTHTENVSINLTLAPPPGSEDRFRNVLYLSSNHSGVNVYSGLSAALTSTASDVHVAAAAYFGNQARPGKFVVSGYTAAGGGLAASDFVSAIEGALNVQDFYLVTIDSRASGDQQLLAAAIAGSATFTDHLLSKGHRLLAVGLTDIVPTAAYTNLNERITLLYHDDTTNRDEVGWAARVVNISPSVRSAPWDAPVKGGTPVTLAQGTSDRSNILNNGANVGLPYGNEPYYVDPGQNVLGRPCHELVTADWTHHELQQRVISAKVARSLAGRKWPMNGEGQALIRSIVDGLVSDGVTAQHFAPGQYIYTEGTIDQSTQTMSFSFQVQMLGSARLFVFDVELAREQIVAEV